MHDKTSQQIASLGVHQIFKIFRIAKSMAKSHRLGTETVGDHVMRATETAHEIHRLNVAFYILDKYTF
jgi:hypothetical protein